MTLFEHFDRYSNPQATVATQSYVNLAQQHGLDPAQMALAFINSRPFVTSNIIGATTMAQLSNNLASIDIKLSTEVLEGIDAIHTEHPNPAP